MFSIRGTVTAATSAVMLVQKRRKAEAESRKGMKPGKGGTPGAGRDERLTDRRKDEGKK